MFSTFSSLPVLSAMYSRGKNVDAAVGHAASHRIHELKGA